LVEREREREREIKPHHYPHHYPHLASPGMASLDDIRKLIQDGNAQLRKDITSDIMNKVKDVIAKAVDEKLAAHEEKLCAEIRALQERTAALEGRPNLRVPSGMIPGAQPGNASKRARSAPAEGEERQDRPCAVITGFPVGTRRKDIEQFVNDKLKATEGWSHLKAFAPNIRGTVALIRMDEKEAVYEFTAEWRKQGLKYNDACLRARGELPPIKRKSNAKVYLMKEYLSTTFGKDFDPDFRSSSVWGEKGIVVKWNMDSEEFEWDDAMLAENMLEVDKAKAVEYTRRK
jgi:hypothetical protein